MNYGNIKYYDIANGLGVRTSVFVSGCTNCCPGCFQKETWDFNYGKKWTKEVEDMVVASLDHYYVSGLSVLGGEPMEPENQEGILPLLKRVKTEYTDKNIWLYTGFTLDELLNPNCEKHTNITEEVLSYVDILVDGRYMMDKKDISLNFRGSTNQRIIRLPETLQNLRECDLIGVCVPDSKVEILNV